MQSKLLEAMAAIYERENHVRSTETRKARAHCCSHRLGHQVFRRWRSRLWDALAAPDPASFYHMD